MDNQEQPAGRLSPRDIEYRVSGISPRRQAFNDHLMRLGGDVGEWLRHHWLAVVNTVLGTWIALAVITPIGYAMGFTGPASTVFHAYRFACDELPTHSFFINGYQVCLCERCLAIYSSVLLAGIALAIVRKHRTVRGINWWGWVACMLPMALDGGTQFFGLRESSVWLRLLTGAIFGIGTALFTLPQLQGAASDEFAPPRRVSASNQSI
jgi:uncharacterized membrane protein